MSYDVRLRALRATANLGLPADRYYRIETDVAFRRVDPVPTSEIRIVAVTDQAQLRWWIEDESVLSRELISIDSRDHDWLARLRARVEALPQHLKFDEVKKLFFVDLRIGSETLRPKDVRWEADGIVFQYDNPRSRVTTEVDYKIHYESIQARSQKSFAFYIAELTHGYVATLDLPDDVLSPAFFSAMLDTSPDPLECVALGRDGRTIKIDTRGRWCFPGTGVVAYWD